MEKNYGIRIEFVDIAKIVGMFLIIYGHTLRGGMLTTWLYSFHVPLFFFLSGVTFHYESYQLKEFIMKRLKVLLFPFLIWALISIVIFTIISDFVFVESSLCFGKTNPFVNILMGYCDVNSPLWFLPCLFITELLMWFVIKIYYRIGKWFCLWVGLISLVVCSAWPIMNEKEIFWNVHTAVIILPFSMLGYLFGEKLDRVPFTLKGFGIAFVFTIGGGLIGTLFNHQIGYLGCCYGNPILFYLSAILSILGICYMCKGIPYNRKMLYLGSNTMEALVMHKFLVMFF